VTDRTPQEGDARTAPGAGAQRPDSGPVTRDRNPLEYWARATARPEPVRTAPAAPASPAAAEAQQELLEAITRVARVLDAEDSGAAAELEQLARAYALVTSGYVAGGPVG
jgi:hypothetical protein